MTKNIATFYNIYYWHKAMLYQDIVKKEKLQKFKVQTLKAAQHFETVVISAMIQSLSQAMIELITTLVMGLIQFAIKHLKQKSSSQFWGLDMKKTRLTSV